MNETLPRERLSAAIRGAHAQRGIALVAFLTAGYPSREKFREHLAATSTAADVIEIGVPFTDPMADGVTIQRSSHSALAQGVSLRWILAELAAMPASPVPLVLMSYLNPLLAVGLSQLAAQAARCGVTGFIVPDLPLEEAAPLHAALSAHGLALIQMVTPVTDDARLTRLCAEAEGFVYAVTMTGTTGKSAAVPTELTAYLARVRARAQVPVCAGFGIRGRDQVKMLEGHVDGVIIGSALVEVLERGESPVVLLNSLRGPRA